jgi:small subunit ribosomal protein S6
MPLYELLCLAKPALERQAQVNMMQRVGQVVMEHGGVVMGLKSYGEQHLAYDIRKPFLRFDKVRWCAAACACIGV